MKLRNISRISAYAFGLALVAAPVSAAEFGMWDADRDAGLNNSEFRTGFEKAGVFNEWDADSNAALTESEFETGLGDNATAFNTRFGEDAFNEWDVNNDTRLTDSEFYDGVYASYDENNNNIIEEPEFGDVGDDMGDGGLWDV
ncbi:hypothetical protein [Microvirga splendida]|uniref:EF hand n=1 Tax=Microvirga splendida TaxID=2795727 RepID=A0ABS0Y463_9HYPH|nr:hypothetical protein [Microvirga splendida]MBJ6127104.1 hypothetical protein [Microvirga splendida]